MVVGFGALLIALVGIAWTFILAFIIDRLAGPFDGEPNFDAAYACIALSVIPYAAGSILGMLPWIGWLLSIAASIYSLVLAYKFIPIFLKVHEDSRVKHFVATIVIAFVVSIVFGLIMGGMAVGTLVGGMSEDDRRAYTQYEEMAEEAEQGAISGSDGILGGFERQAGFAEAAAEDTFTPPADGKLSRQQGAFYADVLGKKSSNLAQQLVTGLMIVGIVIVLEIIDIDHE